MVCTRRIGLLMTAAVGVALCGCAGGIHRHGEQQFAVTGSYGFPIQGDSIWPEGKGEAENIGVSTAYRYFLRDRLAVGAAITPYRKYIQSDGDSTATELQVGLRYFFWEFDIADRPIGLFAEALGGLMYSTTSVPEAGSNTNFTQDTGVGFEMRVTDVISWVGGYRYRHLSHGHIFAGGDNPGQNDHQVYTGIAITW